MILVFSRTVAVVSAMLLPLVGQVALAQSAASASQMPTISPAPDPVLQPATTPLPATQPLSVPTESAQERESAQSTPVSCPPNQFASAFSDVLPTDWAYEAVNRLAIGEARCFPLPVQSSN